MDKDKQLEIIESLQQAVEQMRIDDIEEQPESAFENFQCQCCGESKMMAGSMPYNDYTLCNDCVLLAEIGFSLNKINDIDELIDSMEEKRLENMCSFILEENANINN